MSKQVVSGEKWRIVKKIAHNPEASIVAFIALIAQVRHAQHVFYVGGHEHNASGLFSSWAYALAVESATLFFVLQGWVPVSWAFAIGSMVLNVAYYTITLEPTYGALAMFDPGMLAFTWWRWLLAIFLPVTIASFSHAVEASSEQVASGERAPVASGERVNLFGKWASVVSGKLGKYLPGQEVSGEPVQVASGQAVSGEPVQVVTKPTASGQVASGELTIDHQEVLAFLAGLDKPAGKSEIMQATGHHYNKLERKRNGKLTGLLTDLIDAGLVKRASGGKYVVTSVAIDPHLPVVGEHFVANGTG